MKKINELEKKHQRYIAKQMDDAKSDWWIKYKEKDARKWKSLFDNFDRIMGDSFGTWIDEFEPDEYRKENHFYTARDLTGKVNLYIGKDNPEQFAYKDDFMFRVQGLGDENGTHRNFFLTIGANLFSRQVDYGFGIKGRFPIQRELEEDDYYDKNGIVHNELPALLNNLMLENSLRKLSQGLDMEVEEWTSESTVNSPLIWKYGFKLDVWQMYDPETDDLFPNSADLIEAYLEGRAEELRKKTLKRRLELMKEEVNKLFYEFEQQELEERMDRETTNEAERDQFTDEQLAEIAELIEENRGLKK